MTTQFLLFNAEINAGTTPQLNQALVDAINDSTITDIYIGFSTTGGGVAEGVALHQLLRASPKPVTVHGIGNVDSMGIAVLLGGQRRYASPGTRFIFHSVGTVINGRVGIPDLNERLAALRSDELRITQIWESAETKLEHAEATALFEREHGHDCNWALAHGFIHEIRDFGIPMGARLRQVA
jgi:ATP-dependent Clp protease, protease subunit